VKTAFALSTLDWLILLGFLVGFILGVVAITFGKASTPIVVITGSAAVFVVAKLCGAYRRVDR